MRFVFFILEDLEDIREYLLSIIRVTDGRYSTNII